LNLKTWLVSKNITQAQIAKALQIDPTRISKFVCGVQRLSEGQLVDLSNYLGVSVEALLVNEIEEGGRTWTKRI
jgi:transcriptional regulator with XRE-family HTH domain